MPKRTISLCIALLLIFLVQQAVATCSVNATFTCQDVWNSTNRNYTDVSSQNSQSSWGQTFSITNNGIDAVTPYSTTVQDNTSTASNLTLAKPDGLVLYLPFDENTGAKAYDLSGNANDGTCYGSGAGDG